MLEENINVIFERIKTDEKFDLFQVALKTKTSIIAREYLKSINNKLFVSSILLCESQKKRNKIFEQAIENFVINCNEYGVKPIFFKGLVLAYDLYEKPESRLSFDIDVIVRNKDFYKCDSILKKMGYRYEYEASDYYKKYKDNHVEYIKFVDGERITIEVHSSFVNPTYLFNRADDDFGKYISIRHYCNVDLFTLNTEWNIVALALHFIKHLPLKYFQNIVFEKDYEFNFGSIHDIALVIYKNKGNISFENVFRISNSMKINKYIYFVISLVNKIYKNLKIDELLYMVKNNCNNSFMSYEQSEKHGLGKLLWLFDMYCDYSDEIGADDFILGRLPESFNILKLVEKGENDLIINHKKLSFEKHSEMKLKDNDRIDIKIRCIVDIDGFHIKYHCRGKKCVYFNEDNIDNIAINENDKCYHKDGVELVIVKSKSIVHKMFTFSNGCEKANVVIYSDNTGKITQSIQENIKFIADVTDNSFSMSIDIKWESIKLEGNCDFLFNIAALISDPENEMQYCMCPMFGDSNDFWKLSGVRLKLIKR